MSQTQVSPEVGRRIALLLCNNKYDEPDMNVHMSVPAEQHMRALEQVLKDRQRGSFEVTTVINGSKADAERQIIDLFRNKNQKDFVMFYFAGQAFKDSDGMLHFAMAGTKRDELEVTSVSAEFIKARMDRSFSERIVVILDCGFSSTFDETTPDISKRSSSGWYDFDGQGYGRIVLAATDAQQEETNDFVFTRHLVEGIATGEADGNGDGLITTNRLFSYIYDRTVKAFPTQTPKKIVYAADGELIVARNPLPSRLQSDLVAAITHADYHMRLAAIFELEEILFVSNSHTPQLTDQIKTALKRLASDSNRTVSRRANTLLDTLNYRDTSTGKQTKQLALFLSSPDDVMEERLIVRRVIEKLNRDGSIGQQIHIQVHMRNDTDTFIRAFSHATPEGEDHKGMVRASDYDVVVILLWSKMGTALPADVVKEDGTIYESLTEWDYEEAIKRARDNNGHPEVLVYHSQLSVSIRPGESNIQEKIAQFDRVNHFFTRFHEVDSTLRGHYARYDDLDQFEAVLENHLRNAIRNILVGAPFVYPPRQPVRTVQTKAPGNSDLTGLITPYLNWVIEKHSQLELRGLGGDAQLPTIPLDSVYVALKANRVNTYEREQSQQLLEADTADILLANIDKELSAIEFAEKFYDARQQAIITHPYMPSIIERDRPGSNPNEKASITVTLGDAFCKERWMVILGDPGSGKTTLARWIALQLASVWIRGKSDVVEVPAYQIDPQIDKSDKSIIKLGPLRIPVLLRVSEFAEALQKANHKGEALSLVDFLGHHSWLKDYPNLAQEKLNALIKRYLQLGKVVVILDGMDEITEASQRDDVIRLIEVFINDWINARGNAISPQEKLFLWDMLRDQEPAKTGGNQIIITSRIAGYHVRPIKGQITHVTIQPMPQIAVEHFCDAWTLAVHKQLFDKKEDSETIHNKAEREAAGLKAAIFERPRIQELASNPLLVTILALVYREKKGRLPEQRVELYHAVMEILIEEWRITTITTGECIYILSPLAAYIHQHHSSGLIKQTEMKEIIRDELAKYRQLDVAALPPAFEQDVNTFIRTIVGQVGILVERSHELYGFLHLTFQEYLAALFLIREKQNAPQAIIEKLDDTRWREPILMALGRISGWGPRDQQTLLTTLLDVDDPLGKLVPRSTLLIVSALPEMVHIPDGVMHEIIRRLLTTYADRDGIGQFATLHERISNSFKTIYNSAYRPLLEGFLKEAILNIEQGDRELALAAASLIAENVWQSDQLIGVLLRAFPYDDLAWRYPIMRSLSAFVLSETEGLTPPTKPEMPEEDRQELERLEKIVAEMKNGKREEDLKKSIHELEAYFALLRQKLEQELSDLRTLVDD